MKRLEQLPQIANEALGGLNAGIPLKNKILAKSNLKPKPFYLRPAFGAALSLCVVVALVTVLVPKGAAPDPDTIHSIAAGQNDTQPKLRAMLDLPQGSIRLSGTQTPEYRSVWAAQQGADFPLVAVEGKYYRLMTNPSSIPESLLGDELGQIAEYTSEPSLSTTDSLFSNAVSQGETVYAISGMNGAAIAANVNGTLRIFQRVSYAGNARVGNETLSDTLQLSGTVTGLELSGKGSITDSDKASALVETLLANADYQNATLLNTDCTLLIQLDSGLALQLMVQGDTLSACGSWACPEFFEAFDEAVK